jgi:hypothetical protein
MPLSKIERERIKDSRVRIQAIADSLKRVAPQKVPDMDAIKECLQEAEKSLELALRSSDTDLTQ